MAAVGICRERGVSSTRRHSLDGGFADPAACSPRRLPRAQLVDVDFPFPVRHRAIELSEEFNQQLSEKRALAVRDFLVEQGIPVTSLGAQGFGKAMPVAPNDTAAGRQRNRRVELIVAGDVIGIPFTARRPEVPSAN